MRYARFCVSGTNYYICIKFVYIRKYHVKVRSKSRPNFFFEKDAHWVNQSKTKKKKKVPTNYKWAGISPNFYPTASEPLEINFPAQFTSKMDIGSFFPIPVPPCGSDDEIFADLCMVLDCVALSERSEGDVWTIRTCFSPIFIFLSFEVDV